MQRVTKAEFINRLRADSPPGSSNSPTGGVSPTTAEESRKKKSAQSFSTIRDELKIPSVAEYRGTNAVCGAKPSSNQAASKEQLCLPMGPVEESPKEHMRRVGCDVTRHASEALVVGHGSIFDKSLSTRTKGWSPGKF